MSEYKQNEVKTEITEKYNSLKGLIEIYTTLNEYREAINVNFDKRRNLMKKVGLDFKCLVVTELDKFLATTALEIRNMGN